MEYIQQENILSWTHIHVYKDGRVEDKPWKGNVYLIICSSGNRYYLELLDNKEAHIYPYNDCYSKLTELKIVWSKWDDIPKDDQEEFERECIGKNWSKIWNKGGRSRRLLHLFLDV
jgi:hypothetical protein